MGFTNIGSDKATLGTDLFGPDDSADRADDTARQQSKVADASPHRRLGTQSVSDLEKRTPRRYEPLGEKSSMFDQQR
jgi:hypothetical protein